MRAIATRLKARGIRIIPESSVDIPQGDRQADGIHMNPEGHRWVASQLLPKVSNALGRQH